MVKKDINIDMPIKPLKNYYFCKKVQYVKILRIFIIVLGL